MFQIRGGQLRQITNDHTIGVLAWSADLLALVLARHLDGRPDRRYGPAGPPADTCCSPVDWGRLWTTDRTLMYSFSRCFRRVAGAAGRPGRRPASVSRLTPYQWARVLQAGQAGSRLHFLLRMRACRSAAIYGAVGRPAARRLPPSCPMRRGVLAYHRRDNVTGQIRAQIRPPGPSAKITQGARPLRQEPVHAT